MRKVYPLLLILAVSGCQQAPPPPPTITDFAVQLDQGLLTHDVQLTHKASKKLSAVHLTITVLTERDQQTAERHWGQWRSGETKVVNIAAIGGPIQEVNISGTAKRGVEQEPVQLKTGWTFSYGNNEP